MKCITQFLDNVNTIARQVDRSTRRRRRLRREHLVGAFQVACVLSNGLAAVVPKVVPVAVVLNGLNRAVDANPKGMSHAPDSESDQ